MGVLQEMMARRLARHGIGHVEEQTGGRVYKDDVYRELRLGGVVDIDAIQAKMILAQAAGAIFVPPTKMRQRIIGVGTMHDAGFTTRRFYLEEHSDDVLGYFLQVMSNDRTGLVEDKETKLFQQVLEDTPAGDEQRAVWLGGMNTTPVIGCISVEIGGNDYFRVFGVDANGNGDKVIPPRAFEETIEDSSGSHSVAHKLELYGRWVGQAPNQFPEWLYISAVSERGAGFALKLWIEAHAGFTLSRAEFTAS